jgi:hypothetical protein
MPQLRGNEPILGTNITGQWEGLTLCTSFANFWILWLNISGNEPILGLNITGQLGSCRL